MADSSKDPQFSTFREAFCAYYRCRPEAFERKAFWKSVYRHALLFAIPIWLFNRRFFHADLEVIRQFGNCRSAEEFSVVTGEFSTTNRLERSIRRGKLRIRVSGTRLLALHDRLSRYVRPHAPEVISGYVVSGNALDQSPARSGDPTRGGESAPVRSEGSALVTRRLKQAHDELTTGRPLREVLRSAGYTEDSLIEALDQNASGNPAFAWLRDYLRRERQLAKLETENAQLLRKVANLSMEIDRLRDDSSRNSNPIIPGVG